MFYSILFNLHEFECFPVFSLRLVSSPLWLEKMLDMISIFLNLLRLVLCPIMGLCLKMFHVHLKRMCILLLWDERLSLYISVKSIWSRALFNATISLLIFCLEDLSIFDSAVLKSLTTIIVLLSTSFLKPSKIFFMYLGAPMLGAYIFTMFMSSWWSLPFSVMKWPSGSLFMALFLKSILSDMSVTTPTFIFCPFAWNIFF